MSEGHHNSVESSSVVGITTNKKSSPKLNSQNESTPAVEYTSNREQKKSEERRKCKKRDDDYLAMREEIVSLAKAMHRTDAVRIKIWLTKLDETLSLLTWKTNRNQHAALMIKQLRQGNLGDCFSHIPSGHLGNLPSHLKNMASLTDETSKKECDNQKMSPLVASFMPSQASNPFFRLTESEIPASPCSESACSESSQHHDQHIARRVSFSPDETSKFLLSSQLKPQKLVVASASPVLKTARASHLRTKNISEGKMVENSLSAFAHDSNLIKSTQQNFLQQNIQQMHAKPQPVTSRNQNANSSQGNQGVPNNISPGFAGLKQTNSGTFAAATYSSPTVHSPTPRPRFSHHDGIAHGGNHWIQKRTTPETKDIVNGVSCSPPSLMRGTSRNNEGHTSTPNTSLLRLEAASSDSHFCVESIRTPISRLQQLQEPHSHSPMA